MNYNKAYQNSLARSSPKDSLDFWRTPPQATQALFDKEDFGGIRILEPACGIGDMAKVIYNNLKPNQILECSDIEYRGYYRQTMTENFLEKIWFTENIITNPPFNLAKEFVDHSLKYATEKVAMLLKLEFLQSQKRTKWFKQHPLKTVYVFEYRIPFWQDGYDKAINNQRHAWFVWDKSYSGKPMLDWIEVPEEGLNRQWWKA